MHHCTSIMCTYNNFWRYKIARIAKNLTPRYKALYNNDWMVAKRTVMWEWQWKKDTFYHGVNLVDLSGKEIDRKSDEAALSTKQTLLMSSSLIIQRETSSSSWLGLHLILFPNTQLDICTQVCRLDTFLFVTPTFLPFFLAIPTPS